MHRDHAENTTRNERIARTVFDVADFVILPHLQPKRASRCFIEWPRGNIRTECITPAIGVPIPAPDCAWVLLHDTHYPRLFACV